jgi:hypothetical protein
MILAQVGKIGGRDPVFSFNNTAAGYPEVRPQNAVVAGPTRSSPHAIVGIFLGPHRELIAHGSARQWHSNGSASS